MNHSSLTKLYYTFLWSISFFACSPKIDQPPTEPISNLHGDLSISNLKKLHTAGHFELLQQDNLIEAVVVADDKSGNFYKMIVVQDSTGGIAINLDDYNLYTSYPVGRKIFIRTKGLYLGDYGGAIQLGAGIDSSLSYRKSLSPLASTLFTQYIEKGSFDNTIVPKKILPTDLMTDPQNPLQYTLVAFDNIQFNNADVGKTLGDTSLQNSSSSYTLQNCQGQSILLRNSSYARFAKSAVPSGNGTLTAIYSVYNEAKQLAIRDTSDLHFTNVRCNEQPVDTNIITTIKQVRALYTNASLNIPYGTVLKGTVISSDKNESNGNYKIQDQSGRGIIIYAPNITALELGKTYLFNISGATLELFGSDLEITNISNDKIFTTRQMLISPKDVTIQQIGDSLTEWAATLVRIKNVFIGAPIVTTYGRTYGMQDATGSLNTYIRSTAAFTLQQGSADTVVGYVANAQGAAQLILRNANDIISSNTSIPITGVSFSGEYTFANVTTTSGTTDPTPAPVVNGIGFGAFKAVGVNTNSSSAGRFSFTRWPIGATSGSNDFTGGLNTSSYYEITIAPNSNAQLTLQTLAFTLQRSATGPRQWAVRSSVDNFAQNLPAFFTGSTIRVTSDNIFQIEDRNTTTAQTGCSIGFANTHTNIIEPITLRFYAMNSESTSGSFSLNKVTINGSVK